MIKQKAIQDLINAFGEDCEHKEKLRLQYEKGFEDGYAMAKRNYKPNNLLKRNNHAHGYPQDTGFRP